VNRAIISDIHGNLEAFQAVLEDINLQKVDEIFCLGDVVGYGPNPCECVELVQKHCKVVLLGNHDQGVLFDPEGFNVVADKAIQWTREQLEQRDRRAKHSSNQLMDFLGELPRNYRDTPGNNLFVHGSARRPIDEYVFPEDRYNALKMQNIFELIDRYCFQGHTHIPGVFSTAPEFTSPDVPLDAPKNISECRIALPDGKAMINVGSVGQPRDQDPRSCYVIVDDEQSVRFRRVPYPCEKTCEKIHAIDKLDNFLGDRLLQGR